MAARQCAQIINNMAPSLTPCVLLLVFGAFAAFTHASRRSLPKDMHRDIYCLGCEMTMKVVDRALRHAAKKQLDVIVPEMLHKVCKPGNFEISEYSKDTMSEACEHIVDEHGTILEAVLVSHYSHESNPSYLDLVQRVCHDLTDACHGVMHDNHDHNPLEDEARVVLDRDSNEFVVLPGKNLKVAKPVVQVHEEL